MCRDYPREEMRKTECTVALKTSQHLLSLVKRLPFPIAMSSRATEKAVTVDSNMRLCGQINPIMLISTFIPFLSEVWAFMIWLNPLPSPISTQIHSLSPLETQICNQQTSQKVLVQWVKACDGIRLPGCKSCHFLGDHLKILLGGEETRELKFSVRDTTRTW